MLVLCDFDGTIAQEDVTNLIWDKYRTDNWREILLPDYRAGRTNAFQVMYHGYEPLSAPAEELLEFVRPRVKIRSGFDSFHQLCRTNEWPIAVVSQGIDWYIRAFLPEEIPSYSFTAELNGHWQVKLPPGVELADGQDFKVYILEKLIRQHPELPITFIGDGRNDFPIAQKVDRVFAVKGSSLARLCRENRVAHLEFSCFTEVVAALNESGK